MADQGSIANLKQNINENIVQNTTKEITGTKMNTVLNNIVDTLEFNGRDFFNVNEYREKTDAYADAAAARTAVPDEAKKSGLVITYLLADGWYIDQFVGSNISGWGTASNWKSLGPVTVSQNSSTGSTEIKIGNTIYKNFNSIFAFSSNADANQFVREIFVDFGTSGYSLSDVKNITIRHQAKNAFGIIFFDSGFNVIADFHYKTQLPSNLYEDTAGGITVKIIYNPDAPIQGGTWYKNITLYDACLNINNCPIISAFLSVDAEKNRAITEETKNSEEIEELMQSASETVTKDITSQLVLIDNVAEHTINADGSFGTDAMYLLKVGVEGFDKAKISLRAYINSGHSSLLYAFYSSASILDATTFISGSDLYSGSFVEQITFNNVVIPANAKTLVIARRGGTDLVEVSKRTIDIVSGVGLKQNLDYSASKIIKYIKSDGTGDYQTIQEAINSITDASITKRYELRLCNDEKYTDLTDLWIVNTPLVHNTNANPTTAIAAIITKDWIDIVGNNFRRKVIVEAPDTMDVTKQQYVQTLYLMGNCTIDNIDFIVKNGRYAIHQESGGSINSLDYNARTILKNSTVIHKGNVHGTGWWNSCYAQANGACPGLQLEYHNVIWFPAFYMHQNANFDSPNKYTFERCRIFYPKNGEFDGVSLGMYIGMNGSGQNSRIKFIGCDMYAMEFSVGMMGGNLITNPARDVRTMIPEWTGYGNNKMRFPTIDFGGFCLAFKTTSNNHTIKVTGGTAMADIFGEELMSYPGVSDAIGFCCGTEFYGSRDGDYSYTLAHRLGNCANNAKTLKISLDGVEQTIAFNENFVTADGSAYTYQTVPAYSDGNIISYINNQLTGIVVSQYLATHRKGYPMNDAAEYGFNYSNKTMFFGAAVKRDLNNPFGWVCCTAGEQPEGLVCERINPDEGGMIALVDKNYFRLPYGLSVTPIYATGTMLKVATANGEFSITTNEADAVLVAVAPNCFAKK